MTPGELAVALTSRGLIAENQSIAPDAQPENASPWYVQVMLGACAWIAGLFLLAFILLAVGRSLYDNAVGLIFVAVLACGGAAFIYIAAGERSAFGSQFALAMSITGQVAFAIGLGQMGKARGAIWGMFGFEIALAFIMRNRLHRMLSAFSAVFAWALCVHEMLFHELPGAQIMWGTSRPPVYEISILSVVLWIVVWIPVAYGAYWLVKNEARWMAEGRDETVRPIAYGVIAALAIAPLATHPASLWMALGLGPSRELTDGSLSATALWPLLALFLALLAIALAFALRNRALMGVAILFALLEISGFYYILGTTLLVKSIIMIVLGAALIAAAQLLVREPQ